MGLAEKATYALRLLQSEGELTIASTGKDPATGRLETQEYRVEGPVMIFLTTTAIEIDETLFNRCIVLTVDEEREHSGFGQAHSSRPSRGPRVRAGASRRPGPAVFAPKEPIITVQVEKIQIPRHIE